jgi:SAM-dependent methyltransferase
MSEEIKLNLGSGGRPLKNYINVDMDTLEEMKIRYPDTKFDDDIKIEQYDLFNLPYPDDTVDEVRSEGLIEHLPFVDEPKFFYEVKRVLKPGGLLYLTTVDFEATVKFWLEAKDDWKDFYRNDDEAILNKHWFGTYEYSKKNRWGYLTSILYGSQNGEGQFHCNCYTEEKFISMCKKLNFKVLSINKSFWKDDMDRDPILELTAKKI